MHTYSIEIIQYILFYSLKKTIGILTAKMKQYLNWNKFENEKNLNWRRKPFLNIQPLLNNSCIYFCLFIFYFFPTGPHHSFFRAGEFDVLTTDSGKQVVSFREDEVWESSYLLWYRMFRWHYFLLKYKLGSILQLARILKWF